MKRTLKLFMSLTMSLSLIGCSSKSATTYNIGDTVSTDTIDITLIRGEFAIALKSQCPANYVDYDNTYFLPKEYDSEDDADNPYVASTGKALASFTFTIKNNDRRESFNKENFIVIKYNGKEYRGVDYGAKFTEEDGWANNHVGGYSVSNILVLSGQEETYRCYCEIDEEPENLTAPFEITFELSDDQSFTFVTSISEDDTPKTDEYISKLDTARHYVNFSYKHILNMYNGFSTDITDNIKPAYTDIDVEGIVSEMVSKGNDEQESKEKLNQLISDLKTLNEDLLTLNKTHDYSLGLSVKSQASSLLASMDEFVYKYLKYTQMK